MNNVSLVGKIIRKNEMSNVTYLTIAVKTAKKDTEYISVTVFQTDFVKQYFPENKWIGILGHIHINKHNDKYSTEIIADDLYFVGDKTQVSADDILPWEV